ncbi:hypothetical protein ACXIZN_41005 [Amycolatopsis sp. TRM77291]
MFATSAVADSADDVYAIIQTVPMGRGVNPLDVPPPANTGQTRAAGVERKQGEPTPEQTRQALNPDKHVYSVDSSRYASGSKAMANPGDPVLPQECVDYFLNHETPPDRIWLKSRFASCHAEHLVVNYYKRNSTLPIGRAHAEWALTVNMSWNARQALVTTRIANWGFVGDVNKSQIVGVEVACNKALPSSGARCQTPSWGHSESITGWQAITQADYTFQFEGEDPPNPQEPDQIKPEKRTLYSISSYAYGYGGPGPWDNIGQTQPVSWPLRCDVARSTNPNYAKSSDCVFHGATGWLRFNVNDPAIAESAQLYYDAHQDFGKTYPGGGQGKYVPGNIGVPAWANRTEPIRRNFYDKLLQTNNYNTSVKFCKDKWGTGYKVRPDGKVNECDEFPFKTTYEGSFTITPDMLRTVAVRPVLKEHNQETGARWGLFLAEDHILDGDSVFVEAYK